MKIYWHDVVSIIVCIALAIILGALIINIEKNTDYTEVEYIGPIFQTNFLFYLAIAGGVAFLFLLIRIFSDKIEQFFLNWFVNPYRFLMCKFTGEEFVPIVSYN